MKAAVLRSAIESWTTCEGTRKSFAPSIGNDRPRINSSGTRRPRGLWSNRRRRPAPSIGPQQGTKLTACQTRAQPRSGCPRSLALGDTPGIEATTSSPGVPEEPIPARNCTVDKNTNNLHKINELSSYILRNQRISPKSVQFPATLYLEKLNPVVTKNASRCNPRSMSRRIATTGSNVSHVL